MRKLNSVKDATGIGNKEIRPPNGRIQHSHEADDRFSTARLVGKMIYYTV